MSTAAKRVSVFDAALPAINYHGVRQPDEAHRIIARVRRQSPIAMGPYGPELLTHDLVRSVLRDPRFVMPPANGLAMQGVTSGPLWDRVSALIVGIDGAEHKRLRRLVSQAFTPRAAERMRTACGAIMSELVDRQIHTGRCDVVADIARSYPVPIICTTLGVPREDWDLFSDCLRGISKAFGGNAAAHTPAILAAWRNLDAYLDDLIERRRRSLTDDLISELIRAEDDGDRLTRREILDLVAILLLAGTDTTRNQLAAAVQVFVDHPDQWALLADHPELAPHAIEEVMRHTPASFSAIRVAVEDVDFDGIRCPAGTCVVVNTAAANRDPARYEDPERFDITRQGPAAMLTFGGGAHHCLGAHLARIELAEGLVVMARRMGGIRRAGPAPWRPTREVCIEIGWQYEVFSGLPRAHLQNLRWLAGYRHDRHAPDGDTAGTIRACFAAPVTLQTGLRRASTSTGRPLDVLTANVLHLLWRQQLSVDLSTPLSMTSEVRV